MTDSSPIYKYAAREVCAAREVWEWVKNVIAHFCGHVIIY